MTCAYAYLMDMNKREIKMNAITEKSRITVTYDTVFKNPANEVIRGTEIQVVPTKKAAKMIWFDNVKFENKGIRISAEAIQAFA